ncbi:MAG: hypothetical protein ACXABY_35235 [Candidatus Thorarchaeota archaeon]
MNKQTDFSLTIASVPLPFEGVTGIRQHNAIQSWSLLRPKPEILLLSNDDIIEITQEYDCKYVMAIGENEVGDLSIQSIFRQIDKYMSGRLVCYIDCDVILTDDFLPAVQHIAANWQDFIIVSGRYSIQQDELVNFANPAWQQLIRLKINRYHNHGSDFTVYHRGLYHDIPDFSIGCGAWDGWRMAYALKQGLWVAYGLCAQARVRDG